MSYDTQSSVPVDAKPTVSEHVDEPYAAVQEQLDCCRTYRNGRRQITVPHGGGWGRIATRREVAAPPFLLLAVRSMPGAVVLGAYIIFHGTSCMHGDRSRSSSCHGHRVCYPVCVC
jgi:hypothetical protein